MASAMGAPPAKELEDRDHAHGGIFGRNSELIFALICGALLVVGFAIERLVSAAPGWLPTACYIAAYSFGGFYTLREAVGNLRLKPAHECLIDRRLEPRL